MRRTVFFLSGFLLVFSLSRLLVPGFELQLAGFDISVAWIGAASGLLGLVNGTYLLRQVDFRWAFRCMGVVLIGAAALSFISPTFVGLRETFVPVADTFVLLESGIVLVLLSTERRKNTVPILAYAAFVLQLLLNRLAGKLWVENEGWQTPRHHHA